MTTPYIDPQNIFASDAPTQDKPPAFNNYIKGMDETRSNDGRPTIKQFNFIQQQNDFKFLYIHERGACLPFVEGFPYENNAIVFKDGFIQQKNGASWIIPFMRGSQNLAELTDVAQARTKLDVYSKSEALSKDNNLSELADKTTARTNLDVYSKSETDVRLAGDELLYMPIPYPKSTPPTGYLAMMGQAISQATYPILYDLYGSTLPDLRAYTIRGLDNGRGIDIDRVVLTQQEDAIRNIVGSFSSNINADGIAADATGAFQVSGSSGRRGGSLESGPNKVTVSFDSSLSVPTALENRIKNIAFLYIVKAG